MKKKKSLFVLIMVLILIIPLNLIGQVKNPENIKDWKGKTIMYFSPHPDDETMSAGTLAVLAKNGNKIYVVLYTTGNKGSRDLEMTSERLAQIRKKEDEESLKVLGIPKENMIWLGYDDGMLEYVPQKELCEKVCLLIRKYRPDGVFSYDPGTQWMQWHKTDHRMSAFISLDGARAAAYHLYFPHQRIYEGLQPYTVTDFFFFGTYESNYKVDITEVAEQKVESICKHVSQFGSQNFKYVGGEISKKDRESVRNEVMKKDADGKIYEKFRRLQESLSF